MFYTYVLRSASNNQIYIGSTENIEKRLYLHNAGKVRSTKAYKPWVLLESQSFSTRSEAVRQEKFLKTHQQRDLIKNKYGLVAK